MWFWCGNPFHLTPTHIELFFAAEDAEEEGGMSDESVTVDDLDLEEETIGW